ncbi:hypothetical protein [Myxococcus landrumensis]|uniref:Lipoprotein n=1 Tax=Myxococcus landrumensis TaxID=2813577 RepID=A0ABX7N7V1_9BACT|nr:hypothetical protein [Myxococcus landrumus]QSQ12443.1 hypothetical protein JY572_29360 [Myxococcus landrumus]
MSRRQSIPHVLGLLMFTAGAGGCGTDEHLPTAPQAPASALDTAARAASSSDVCVEVFHWAKSRQLCKPRGYDIGALLTEFKPTQEAMCNTFTDATIRSDCHARPPYVFVPKGSSTNPGDWVAGTEQVQYYFRTSASASTAVYERSLEKLDEIADNMLGPAQSELNRRNTGITNARAHLGDALKARADADRGIAIATLGTQRETLNAYQSAFNVYQGAVQALEPQVTTLFNTFVTFRDGEAAVFTQLQDIAQRASTATLAQLAPLQMELVALSRAESQAPQQLWLDTRRLAHTLSQLHVEHHRKMDPYAAFLTQNNIPRVDLTARSGVILNSIASYTDARYARVSEAVKKLLAGLTERQGALVASQANADTRQTLANAAMLKASETFLANANTRTTALWQMPPKSTKLKLFFLSAKHVDFESILQLEPLCMHVSPTSTAWMETGCIALRRQFTSARNYVNTTLPNMVRLNVTQMRRAGVSETHLADVETHLANANLRQAVLAHDAALRASDL